MDGSHSPKPLMPDSLSCDENPGCWLVRAAPRTHWVGVINRWALSLAFPDYRANKNLRRSFFFFFFPSLCQLLSLVLVLRGWISRRWEGFSLLTLLISYRAVKYPSWNEKEINALLTPDCKWTTNPWTGLLLIFQLFLPHSVFFFLLSTVIGNKEMYFSQTWLIASLPFLTQTSISPGCLCPRVF